MQASAERTRNVRLCIVALALTWLACAHPALAQEAPSIADHSRAYSEARAQGDLTAAEAAASAALTASEQRDGDGGHTAALAFNLARTRVELGQWDRARAPARRAYELARAQGANSPVDILMSQLLYGRVRLHLDGLDAVGFLRGALEDAEARADLASDRYSAAEDLGLWALEMHRYDLARAAWALTANAAEGAPFDAALARGRARAYEGIAITLQSVSRDPVMSARVAREARERFAQAHPLLQPYALLDAADGRLSRPQEVYAQMLAWDATVWSKMASQDSTRAGQARLEPNPTTFNQQPLCPVQVDRGRLFYPAQQTVEGQIGAVVVRLRFDEAGQHVSTDIAAAVGDEDFARMVTQSLSGWSARAETGACVVPAVYFAPITFYFRE